LDCVFVCFALFWVEASTWFPLFWFRSPLFSTATLGPLATITPEAPDWSALFVPSLDWSADCVAPPAELPSAVWL
jgi:hypothetical protein